jgi:hypothetical protein
VTLAAHPRIAAATGALMAVPFLTANAIVGNRIEPFFSLIRPGPQTSGREYVLLFVVVFLLPVGAFIAARPMLRGEMTERRKIYFLNGIIAALLLVAFAMLSIGLGSEIYRCDVLQIPNCD